MPRIRPALVLAAGLAAASSLGCWAVHKRQADLDRAPVVNTGAGATVIYPGQAPPPHPGNLHPREAGYGSDVERRGAPPQPSGSPSAATRGGAPEAASAPPPRSGASAGGGVSMMGGVEVEETRHLRVDEEPQWLKYALLPFAVAAAPFGYAAEKIRGEPEPGPPVPRNADQPRPAQRPQPPPVDYETARLQDLERELARRDPGAATSGAPAAAPRRVGGDIAAELAALRRRASAAAEPAERAAPQPAPAPPQRTAPPPARAPLPPASASGNVDRNGDGTVDHWIHREKGVVIREDFDDDFDGRPDRSLVYHRDTHAVVGVEEDSNSDGRIDVWTTVREGRVVGRRADADGDGHVDTWSFYRDGRITRLERDGDGDGFRDHVAYYEQGRLAREERDEDGDGRIDLVTHFDTEERVRRVEEDADGDGRMDVVSHYEDGRLARRELLDAGLLRQRAASSPGERD